MRILLLLIFFISCSTKSVGKKSIMEKSGQSPVLDEAIKLINLEDYELKTMTISETSFHMLAKRHGGIGLDDLERSLIKLWPKLSTPFDHHPEEAAIIEMEGPLLPKIIGEHILAVNYSKEISKEDQQLINKISGWKFKKSTNSYISSYYSAFKHSRRAYIDDILALGLGHLLLSKPSPKLQSNWFQNGLSLVYGNQTWKSFYRLKHPLYEAMTFYYIKNFSRNFELDQRLEEANTTLDGQYNLVREVSINQIKSALFLNAVRNTIGEAIFDEYVNISINEESEQLNYESLLDQMSDKDQEKVKEIETLFKIQ